MGPPAHSERESAIRTHGLAKSYRSGDSELVIFSGLNLQVAEGEMLTWADVDYDPNDGAVKVRREMEAAFGQPNKEEP